MITDLNAINFEKHFIESRQLVSLYSLHSNWIYLLIFRHNENKIKQIFSGVVSNDAYANYKHSDRAKNEILYNLSLDELNDITFEEFSQMCEEGLSAFKIKCIEMEKQQIMDDLL